MEGLIIIFSVHLRRWTQGALYVSHPTLIIYFYAGYAIKMALSRHKGDEFAFSSHLSSNLSLRFPLLLRGRRQDF